MTIDGAREIASQLANEYFLDFCRVVKRDPSDADDGTFDLEVEDGEQDANLLSYLDARPGRLAAYLSLYGYSDPDDLADEVRAALSRSL